MPFLIPAMLAASVSLLAQLGVYTWGVTLQLLQLPIGLLLLLVIGALAARPDLVSRRRRIACADAVPLVLGALVVAMLFPALLIILPALLALLAPEALPLGEALLYALAALVARCADALALTGVLLALLLARPLPQRPSPQAAPAVALPPTPLRERPLAPRAPPSLTR